MSHGQRAIIVLQITQVSYQLLPMVAAIDLNRIGIVLPLVALLTAVEVVILVFLVKRYWIGLVARMIWSLWLLIGYALMIQSQRGSRSKPVSYSFDSVMGSLGYICQIAFLVLTLLASYEICKLSKKRKPKRDLTA